MTPRRTEPESVDGGALLKAPSTESGETAPVVSTETPALDSPWDEFKVHAVEHLDLLEWAATSLIAGDAPATLLSHAFLGARSLEKSMTSQGLFEGARLARDLARALDQSGPFYPPQLLHICELTVQLETIIQHAAKPLTQESERGADGPVVLVISRDHGLAGRLQHAGAGQGFQVLAGEFPAFAGDLLARATPAAAVLDLHAGGGIERGLLLLEEFSNHVPPIPAIALLHTDALAHRLEVARRGARMILPMDRPAVDVAEAVKDLLTHARAGAPKVMVVDNDPVALGTVASMLDARGLDVTALGDSGRFWEVFNRGAPDLIVLAAELEGHTGLALCREVREDPFWRLIPIVMLTGNNEPTAIERLFAAGADDFVAKPVVGPELVTRITNRLERFYLQRQQTGTDPLTGVSTRSLADQHIRRLMRMVARSRLPLSLVMVDIDGLCGINRRHGVEAGDAVLRRLGQVLLKTLRAEDMVGRLGGDEFVVAMYNTRKHDARLRFQAVLDSFTQELFPEVTHEKLMPRFSAAVVQYLHEGHDMQWLYEAAGQLMAEIKEAGGGQVRGAVSASESDDDELAYDVAIVEEDENVAAVIHRALMTQGIRPIWIRDGDTAIRKLAGAVPVVRAKVVVLERDLPGLDGLAVLHRLVEEQGAHRLRVIMLTNRASEEEVVTAFETGAFDHVSKPFSIRVLTQRIRRALQAA